MTASIIEPGAMLGVLGGGQLGRMFIQAAHRLGYRAHVLVPEVDAPAAQVADAATVAAWDDTDAVTAFAKAVDVVTCEFENVPAATLETAARHAPTRPGPHVLAVAQDRVREKTALRELGVPVTPFAPVASRASFDDALARLGRPAILKSAGSGYDGKGQTRIDAPAEDDAAWQQLGDRPLILEAVAPFELEISVVAARGVDGTVHCFEPFENAHRRHILDVTCCPARTSDAVRAEAIEIARRIMNGLDVVGVLCVEFFVLPGGELLVNELAPRPHNSGHLTIDACDTSQFEQQVRAVCGLPLGSTRLRGPAAMANLLGDLWAGGPPRWADALALENVRLHLYGKTEPRPGRKMGHLVCLDDDVDAAVRRVEAARVALARPPSGDAPRGQRRLVSVAL